MDMVNKVTLIGNLGADPDLRYTPSGQAVCELRLATAESWKDKDGKRQEKTEWHRLVAWGKTGEICAQHLKKGRQVYVEGRIQTRTYDDKEGQKRYVTEIVVNEVKFLGGGDKRGDREPDRSERGGEYGGGGPDDDIPFASCELDAEPSPVARILRRS